MRTRIPGCRPFSPRILCILLLALALAVCCYFYALVPAEKKAGALRTSNRVNIKPRAPKHAPEIYGLQQPSTEQCMALKESTADVDVLSEYPKLDFQPNWLRTRDFWDKSFENRYEKYRNDSRRPMLKVIVVPHSHNDPGWLKTFEQYFELKTKQIINNVVQKLHQYPNMTFIWTEISFLSAWWERSHPLKQKDLKKLIKEGRLEITSGGWVMPDEACSHIYAIIDQFIEGHDWVKNNLGTLPETGWSIDPFGHGPTVPYVLDKSGLKGAIIQRIHYAWKQWLAKRQIEDFYWIPGWSSKRSSLVVHNQPFDIYSIKNTCGPHPSICLSFDFRKIPGEYSDDASKQELITEHNLHSKSKTLIEEYHRIGTLTPHNVVLVPLGDDFRYEYGIEFDAQYTNYIKMFNYINDHKELFNAEVQFGTPLDYFKAMKDRHKNIPSLKGDFFVYSDIFTAGKPAYWSGYFTTRPYLKILARQLEHQLRASEILFTLVSNYQKQANNHKLQASQKRLDHAYEQLVNARRVLGLFQHHDAITGTSKASVMYDYGTKMFSSMYHCTRLQEVAITNSMIPDETFHSQIIVQSEIDWETYGEPAKKLFISFSSSRRKVILFNSLAELRKEIISIISNSTNVRVYDTRRKEYVQHQITPMIETREDGRRVISDTAVDLLFVATLPPLAIVTFDLVEHTNSSDTCTVYCNNCENHQSNRRKLFAVKKMMPGDIQLENSILKLTINRHTGFIRQIYRKDVKRRNTFEIQFGAYQSAQRYSGAYLFMPDYDAPEKRVLNAYSNFNDMEDDNIIIVFGAISTEITTMYLPFLVHTVRIYNVDDPALSHGIYVENVVDFESPPKNRETELFMRIQTDIQNGVTPEFYTDQNGFQYQKRIKIDKLGIEANYYPITTMAWLQDDDTRLTLVTNHAQGASAFEPGRLEVMLDRRMLYDDLRGMGEGVVDNKKTVFQNWIIMESVAEPPKKVTSERVLNKKKDTTYELPSKIANYLSRTLNYPVNVYLLDTDDASGVNVMTHRNFVKNFPSGIHLMMMRTITDEVSDQFPSSACYMVLHRPGYSCSVGNKLDTRSEFTSETKFNGLRIRNLTSVSLTGLRTYNSLSDLSQVQLDPMEVKTYKIQF